jgi:hypothetical protein
MATTAQQIYTRVGTLPAEERFRLATLILAELARAGSLPQAVDSSDMWSEKDQQDLTAFSLSYAETLFPEDDDLV